MKEIIEKLDKKEIINKTNIIVIREYISKKFPEITPQRASFVFADCMNKVIDKNLSQFDEKYRINIRKNLVRGAVIKNSFVISAGEVFRECLRIGLDDDKYIEDFTEWLKSNQEVDIDAIELNKFIEKIKGFNDNNIDEAIEKALKEIEEEEVRYELEVGKEEVAVTIEIENSVIESNEKLEGEKFTDTLKGVLENKKRVSLYFSMAAIALVIFLFVPRIQSLLENNQLTLINVYERLISSHKDSNITNDRYKELLNAEENQYGDLNYVDVDKQSLKEWLNKKNSLLAEEPYISCIIKTAQKFNVNPLLIVAIAGQEQNFVPKNHKLANKIINNPYNVFGSWIEYNTNFSDATTIAARTIVTLRKNKPDNINSIKWINRKYAEDKNWWIGVSKIFNQLNHDVKR